MASYCIKHTEGGGGGCSDLDILCLQPVVELATAERKLTAEVFFFLCVKRAYLTEHICGFRPLPTTCAAPAVAFSPPRQEDGGFSSLHPNLSIVPEAS